MKNTLRRLFDWRAHPASVFLLALPLAAAAFLLLLARAVIEIKLHGDWGFLAIDVFGMALLTLGLWPIRRPILARIRPTPKR